LALNSSEKRLARALLLLARFGKLDGPTRLLPKISQAKLADMIGTTRSRVNFFLNKFKRLGFVDYDGVRALKAESSNPSVDRRGSRRRVPPSIAKLCKGMCKGKAPSCLTDSSVAAIRSAGGVIVQSERHLSRRRGILASDSGGVVWRKLR
jgi:hypothetical protein